MNGLRNAVIEDVDSEFIGQVLDYAVAKELDRKRRLGFDAIIVENNMVSGTPS